MAIALSSAGGAFAAVAPRSAGRTTYRMMFGRCDEPERWISVDLLARVAPAVGSAEVPAEGDGYNPPWIAIRADIVSIAIDDGGTSVAVGLRPSNHSPMASAWWTPEYLESRVPMPDGSLPATAVPAVIHAGISLVRRQDDTVTVAPLMIGTLLASAQGLLRADGKEFVLIEGPDAWRRSLDRAPADRTRVAWKSDAALFEQLAKLAVLSPDGRWIDARDSGWADAVPTQLAERMGLAERESPRAVHAHRDHEVAVAGPGMLAIIDTSSRLCRPFALGADAMHAATDPPRVIDDLRFVDDGHLVTAGLSTVRRWDVRALCEAASVQHGEWLPTPIVLAADGRSMRGGVLLAGAEPRPEVREGRALCAGAHRVALAIEDPSAKQVRAIAVCDLVTGARVVELPAADVELAALGDGDRWLAFASGDQVTVVDLEIVARGGHAMQGSLAADAVEQAVLSRTRPLESKPTALAFFEGPRCVIGDASGRLYSVGWVGAFAMFSDTLQISASPITALAAAGSRFAIATADGRIHTWSPGDPAPAQLTGLPAATSRLAFSADGALLAAATDDDIVRLFDLASRTLVARLYHLEAGWAAVRADGMYDHGGDVSRLSCVSELRTYRLRDLDELLPGSRLPRPR
jgi:WD40 repeat protein